MQASGRGFQTKSERNVSGKSPAHVSAAHIIQLCVMHGTHSQQRLSKYWAQVLLFKVFTGQKKEKKRERARKRKVDVLVPDFEFVRKCTFMFGESKNLLGKELK